MMTVIIQSIKLVVIISVGLFILSVSGQEGIKWKCLQEPFSKNANSSCSFKPTHSFFPASRPDPFDITIDDRITACHWKHIAELTILEFYNPHAEYYNNQLECFIHCMQPYSVVWVDSHLPATQRFMKILPLLPHPIILFLGDGDISEPCVDLIPYKSKLAHVYLTNCLPWAANETDWITCIPIGQSQLYHNEPSIHLDKSVRFRMNNYGKLLTSTDVDNNLIFDHIRAHKDANNSVLVQFGNTHIDRIPLRAYFCARPSNFSKHAGSNLVHVGCEGTAHDKFHAHMARFRFVVSPRGGGYDCYRTWETLLVGAYPIVKPSHLDVLYKDLPVLIVEEWTDITPKLLDETYHRFMKKTWNLDRLYNFYWEQLVYKQRAQMGGAKQRMRYYVKN